MFQFLAPIFDGFAWTFGLIGGGRTGGGILGVLFVLVVWRSIAFWRNAHWQPCEPVTPANVEQFRALRRRTSESSRMG